MDHILTNECFFAIITVDTAKARHEQQKSINNLIFKGADPFQVGMEIGHWNRERLEKTCKIANIQWLYRLKQIKSILQSNRDQLPQQLDIDIQLPQAHENIRGPRDYH